MRKILCIILIMAICLGSTIVMAENTTNNQSSNTISEELQTKQK